MIDDKARALAQQLIAICTEKGLTLGTIESCTGGLISATLTAIDGSSAAFMGGIATYSNDVKHRLAHVPEETIAQFGAVSKQTAIAMAENGRAVLATDLCVSVTGVAGPQGGTPEKPVGLVHFAVATAQGTVQQKMLFGPKSREQIRLETVHKALDMLLKAASA